MEKKKYYKYYKLNSCFKRENKETKEEEIVVIGNEIRGKGLISSYPKWFTFDPEEFVNIFWSKIKKDEYNMWLNGVNFRGEVDFNVSNIESVDTLPDDL